MVSLSSSRCSRMLNLTPTQQNVIPIVTGTIRNYHHDFQVAAFTPQASRESPRRVLADGIAIVVAENHDTFDNRRRLPRLQKTFGDDRPYGNPVQRSGRERRLDTLSHAHSGRWRSEANSTAPRKISWHQLAAGLDRCFAAFFSEVSAMEGRRLTINIGDDCDHAGIL